MTYHGTPLKQITTSMIQLNTLVWVYTTVSKRSRYTKHVDISNEITSKDSSEQRYTHGADSNSDASSRSLFR